MSIVLALAVNVNCSSPAVDVRRRQLLSARMISLSGVGIIGFLGDRGSDRRFRTGGQAKPKMRSIR